jgi:hypothetical protein
LPGTVFAKKWELINFMVMRNRKLGFLTGMLFLFSIARTQNLVVNPGAESAPAGTGWTIISAAANTCAAGTAASTYSNWTMTPDASTNYPAAHGGTKTFFAGCNTAVPAGPFELRQNIDVSADATAIDAGLISYVFSGYIQTPIPPQPDAGRFIVDYLNASSAVLGTSYTTAYQSYSGGSGTTWHQYTNTRVAPIGTRTVRIRLQATVATGPAVNAYFDDISLLRSPALPVTLVSFAGNHTANEVRLKWSVGDAVNFDRFEIEKGTNDSGFIPIGTLAYHNDKTDYTFSDQIATDASRLFYRLKMIDVDGKFSYSPILMISNGHELSDFRVFPNPANSTVVVSGLQNHGNLAVHNMTGTLIEQVPVNSSSFLLDISRLPRGIYSVIYNNGRKSETKKLMVY